MKYLEQLKRSKQQYQVFKAWQMRPHQVAPLSPDAHDCTTCGTHYEGNYCPRCGQSAKIGRYSIKNAILLFLDVWGLGNRGMFRTIRDLLLRPGYMIRDYLSGMQMAYFPPFKLFFLVITLSVVVESGFNIKGENRFKQEMATYESTIDVGFSTDDEEVETDGQAESPSNDEKEKVRKLATEVSQTLKDFNRWAMNNQSFFQLICILLLSAPLYLLFRRSPAFPDMRLSECFVAMVYTSAMMAIISTAGGMLCLKPFFTNIVCFFACIISVKQLSGYSFWKTLGRIFLAYLMVGAILVIAVFLFGAWIAIKGNLNSV